MITSLFSSFLGSGEIFGQKLGLLRPGEGTIDTKVNLVGRVLQALMPERNAKREKHHSFSHLRSIWWLSLLYGVHAQRANPFPAQFELSSLNGTNGLSIYGQLSLDESGSSVSGVGDVNGDGVNDVLIGAPYAGDAEDNGQGKTYVIFGGNYLNNKNILQLASLSGKNGFYTLGEEFFDTIGDTTSFAGDINQDGIDDFLIGASRKIDYAGKVYVVFGSRSLSNTGSFLLSGLDGQNGFFIFGEKKNDNLGNSVSNAGDIDGDGVADILIGAFNSTQVGKLEAGKTYILFGGKGFGSSGSISLANLNRQTGVVIYGEGVKDQLGTSVSCAGDINGDGIDDILIGANLADPNGKTDAGKTYVIFGRNDFRKVGNLELSQLDGTNGFVINGEMANDQSGSTVSEAGDINGDGFDDLLIGAPNASPLGVMQAGKAYLVYGGKEVGKRGSFELTSLNGSNGFVIFGENQNDLCGNVVSSGGDFNKDGLADLLLGLPSASPTNRTNAGKTFVVYGGKNIPDNGIVKLSGINGHNGFVINGLEEGDRSGLSVSNAGDINGDGVYDIIIGAHEAGPFHRESAGASYVIFGPKMGESKQPNPTQNIASTNNSIPSRPEEEGASPDHSTPSGAGVGVGVGLTVTALICSAAAGGVFYWRRRVMNDDQGLSQNDQVQEGNPLYYNSIHSDQSTVRSEGRYVALKLSDSQNNFTDKSQAPQEYYSGHSSGRAEGAYEELSLSPSPNQYVDWPQVPQEHDSSHYIDVNDVNRQHEQYVISKRLQAQEAYDDLEY